MGTKTDSERADRLHRHEPPGRRDPEPAQPADHDLRACAGSPTPAAWAS
ncbi:MAG: hypothetical protein MZV70_28830 [Desulfobacterales bacterium]|nr:hypothetical protein [Desulfobacterales bacterium]